MKVIFAAQITWYTTKNRISVLAQMESSLISQAKVDSSVKETVFLVIGLLKFGTEKTSAVLSVRVRTIITTQANLRCLRALATTETLQIQSVDAQLPAAQMIFLGMIRTTDGNRLHAVNLDASGFLGVTIVNARAIIMDGMVDVRKTVQ